MRFDAPTVLEPAKLNTIAAELQLNLLRFVAWLTQHFGVLPFAETLRCDLDRRLRRAALATERIIFLHAAWRLRHWKPPAPHHSELQLSLAAHACGRRSPPHAYPWPSSRRLTCARSAPRSHPRRARTLDRASRAPPPTPPPRRLLACCVARVLSCAACAVHAAALRRHVVSARNRL